MVILHNCNLNSQIRQETEAQGGERICQRLHSRLLVDLGIEPRFSNVQASLLFIVLHILLESMAYSLGFCRKETGENLHIELTHSCLASSSSSESAGNINSNSVTHREHVPFV